MTFTLTKTGSGTGASLAVDNDKIFANDTARDSYFDSNATKKVQGVHVSSNGVLQKYQGTSWVALTPAITGPKGEQGVPGPKGDQGFKGDIGNPGPGGVGVVLQYSADGSAGWTGALAGSHKFWRWSSDSGSTWSPAYRFVLDTSNVPNATTTSAGVVQVSDGLGVDSSGLLKVKLSSGLAFDASKNVVVDVSNLDVFSLKNAATLSVGTFAGNLNASSAFSNLANATKGSFWICSAAVTIGTQALSPGDQLWCTTTFTGTPTNLNNFTYVPLTLTQASSSVMGAVKIGGVTPSALGTASEGTSAVAARADHVHALPSIPEAGTISGKDLGTAAVGTSAKYAREDHVHQLPAEATTTTAGLMSPAQVTKLNGLSSTVVSALTSKTGVDFTVAAAPIRTVRDWMWLSAGNGSVDAARIAVRVPDRNAAERLCVYWLQQMVTFFKSLENDTHFDQLMWSIPANASLISSLASGTTFPTSLSTTSDMDNSITFGTADPSTWRYASEWYEVIVAADATGAGFYTMWFQFGTFAVSGNTTTMYPFRCQYQTTSDENLTVAPTTSTPSAISALAPKVTYRTSGTSSPSSSPGSAWLWAEPVNIEIFR